MSSELARTPHSRHCCQRDGRRCARLRRVAGPRRGLSPPARTRTVFASRVAARRANAGCSAGSDLDAVIEPHRPAQLAARTGIERAIRNGAGAALVRSRDATAGNGRAREGSVLAVVGSKGAPGAIGARLLVRRAASHGSWPVLLVELRRRRRPTRAPPRRRPAPGIAARPCSAPCSDEPALDESAPRWLVGGSAAGRPSCSACPTRAGRPRRIDQPGMIRTGARRARRQLPARGRCDVGHPARRTRDDRPVVRCHREALLAGADAVLLVLGSGRGAAPTPASRRSNCCSTSWRSHRSGSGSSSTARAAPARPTRETRAGAPPGSREARLAVDARLPWDEKALARPVRLGLPLAAARPRGGYARALARLLETLCCPARRRAARKQRLTVPPERGRGSRAERAEEEVALPWRR